jgi:CBS domain containing-hemolysin-like protein
MIFLIYGGGILALVLLAAFFSAAEMAYSSANRVRLENLADEGSARARAAVYICSRYDDMLSTVLILNDLANIAASSLASVIAVTLAGAYGLNTGLTSAGATVLVTLVIIVFAEAVPKLAAKKNANNFSVAAAFSVRAFMFLLTPVVFVVVWLVKLLLGPFKGEKSGSDQDAVVDELVTIIETVEDEGVIDSDRGELLHSALDFADTSVSEVMTSRVDMLAIDIDDSWDEIMELVQSSPFSRLPVYEDSVDKIIGVLYLNHFFKAVADSGQLDIRPLLLKPCFVYKTMKLPAVLSEMRRSKIHLAIVTDEYGGSMGLVSMEDVFEELVGEIWDETDEVDPEVIERDDNLYELDGDMTINDFLEMLGHEEGSLETDSSTVGGWTIERFGRFPEAGESFSYENLTIEVLRVDAQRVEKVLVQIIDKR